MGKVLNRLVTDKEQDHIMILVLSQGGHDF